MFKIVRRLDPKTHHNKPPPKHKGLHWVTYQAARGLLDLTDPSSSICPVKNITLFRQGELGRLILGALRKADGTPQSAAQIVNAILAAGGHGESARATVAPRVRGNLAYLERRGKVAKTGNGKGAR